MTTIAAGTKLGRYEIRSKIGEGGMGEVYLAQDTSELGRTVALKILAARVAQDKDRLQRFTQEARTVSNLNHPNILTIYEFGQADSVCFIATEFIEGETLRQHVSGRRLKLVDVLDIAAQIVAALNAAHEAGVVHRDIKPENVMVRRDHIVKVLDFGLAKLSEPRPAGVAGASIQAEMNEDVKTKVLVHTEPGLVMGTVSYMSPEQSVGSGVDHRTDIWSAGVLLYEMLAGVVPFEGKDIHRQIIAIQEHEPAPLSHHVEGVPARLEEIVVKCLAKDKDERYQTAKDLLIDLRNLKRRLDVDAEIERTVAPEFRTTSGGASRAGTQSSQPDAGATNAVPARMTSSAEYLVGQVQQHKTSAVIAIGVLVLAIAAIAYYLHARNTEVAIESIAVLPFENQNRDASVEWLSDGVTESIINNLAQLPNLRVSPRSTVFHYKGVQLDPLAVGKELGVRAVLSGRFLQTGDDVTISVELVDVRDNKQLWGDRFNHKVADALAMQQEISQQISERLRLKLSGTDQQKMMAKRNTTNAEAYQFYLKGRYFWNQRTAEGLRKAIEQFQHATDTDPNYALAYVGLADSYLVMEQYAGTPATETVPKARAAAERALQIDNSLAEAHTSMASIYEKLWKWDEAGEEYRRAISLNPNYPTARHWYYLYLLAMKRPDAEEQIRRAEELDPLSPVISLNVAHMYLRKGELDRAIEQGKRIIELYPSYPGGYEILANVYVKQRRYREAVEESSKAAELSGRASYYLGGLGFCYAQAGRRADALATLKELEAKYARRESAATDIAEVHVGLGDKDQAFVWLEKAFEARSGMLDDVTDEQYYDLLRDDPRYADLVHRMGLQP